MAVKSFINYVSAKLLGSTDTSNEVYQQSQGYSYRDVNGNGGHGYINSLSATYGMDITPGPAPAIQDTFVTGNVGNTLVLNPLTDDRFKTV